MLDKETARTYLEDYTAALAPGATVYTILRSVARSGMSRRIDVVVIVDGEPRRITHLVAPLIGASIPRNGEGMRVDGCGMDMGFHVVYSFSSAIHGDGYALNHRWL